MSEYMGKPPENHDRERRFRAVVDALAAGAKPAAVKKEFHDLIRDLDAAELAALEQRMIEQGTPVEEVQRLCDVHAEVFRAGLERGERPDRMSGHPVHTFLAENRKARHFARQLGRLSWFGSSSAIAEALERLRPLIRHYERKENQLFPFLERAGFTGPSKVMWAKHDEIRAVMRDLDQACLNNAPAMARRLARELVLRVRKMIFMEERILFPTALKKLGDADWASIRRGEDAIGYAWIRPGAEYDPALVKGGSSGLYANFNAATAPATAAGDLPLSVGSLPLEWLDRTLKALPVDISFVDADDRVRYYSDSPERVFPRSPGIIGRAVQNCHPPKSVATVERILKAFKNGEKDSADFWIQLNGRFIVIAYKAIRDDNGTYLGTLEISQDVTAIRALEGQRRLLDWS